MRRGTSEAKGRHLDHRERMYAVSVLLLLVVGASSCAGGDTGAASEPTSSPPTTFALVTTINGEVPPGRPAIAESAEKVVDSFPGRDNHILVYRDVRAAGTRAPIHVHRFGVTTCLHSGTLTLFVEGAAPEVLAPGECAWTDPNIHMSAYNPGPEPAVLFDAFTIPASEGPAAIWDIVEEGQQHLHDQFTGPGSDGGAPPGIH